MKTKTKMRECGKNDRRTNKPNGGEEGERGKVSSVGFDVQWETNGGGGKRAQMMRTRSLFKINFSLLALPDDLCLSSM